jgi:hypothetical protein
VDDFHIDPELIPARTPGPLGHQDAADPNTVAVLGDTPGSLGILDRADPNLLLIPPLNFQRSAEYRAFEDKVLQQHIHRTERRGRHRAPDIPEADLEVVEGKYKLRKGAAKKCRALLAKARADLASEKAEMLNKPEKERRAEEQKMTLKGQNPVTRVESIGITSAYRSFEYDSGLWHKYERQKYYPINYSHLVHLSCWEGGQYGWAAVESLVKFISKRKAAPGFSNHTNGIAVDFFTEEAGKIFQAETGLSNQALAGLNRNWEKTWFYRWLERHKAEYGIERIRTEAWHWEFRK